ncbi:MAG: hypothetical protein ABF436_09165 [Acetobacter okinawensis]|uniref:rhamnosyltransferase WsaF family glycosyltransferase n=1 Tax=Acetobacter okinawensis TaxID=1076594 RepID=UPI0039ED88F1
MNSLSAEASRKLMIRWLVPFPIDGSGGHATLFAHIRHMAEAGMTCHVHVDLREPRSPLVRAAPVLERMRQKLMHERIYVHLGHEGITEPCAIAVATSCRNAYDVAASPAAYSRAYFVQDFEPWFQPMGTNFLQAEASYRLGLVPVVLGKWLTRVIADLSSVPPYEVPFGVSTDLYTAARDGQARQNAICYLHQPEKPRRCTELATQALRLVNQERPATAIWSYGSVRKPSLPGQHFGVISTAECARLYGSAAVGLCLSASNPSRVGFEMAACGLPMVDLARDNNLYDGLEDVSLLGLSTPKHLAEALLHLLDNSIERERRSLLGQTIMHKRDTQTELDASLAAFCDILSGKTANSCSFDATIPLRPTDNMTLKQRLVRAFIAFHGF